MSKQLLNGRGSPRGHAWRVGVAQASIGLGPHARSLAHAAMASASAATTAGGRSKTGFKVFGTTFSVDSKYEPIKALGKGAYGVVWCVARRRWGVAVGFR